MSPSENAFFQSMANRILPNEANARRELPVEGPPPHSTDNSDAASISGATLVNEPQPSSTRVPIPPQRLINPFSSPFQTRSNPDDHSLLAGRPRPDVLPGNSLSTTPLNLVTNGTTIWTPTRPARMMYYISPSLTSGAQRVTLKRCILDTPQSSTVAATTTATNSTDAPQQNLYDLLLRGKSVDLIPRQENSYLKAYGELKPGRIFLPDRWKLWSNGTMVFYHKQGEWYFVEKVVARESEFEKSEVEDGQRVYGCFVVEKGVDQKTTDLLVAVWVGKVWRGLV